MFIKPEKNNLKCILQRGYKDWILLLLLEPALGLYIYTKIEENKKDKRIFFFSCCLISYTE